MANFFEAVKRFGLRHGLRVCSGTHCLGCFIGDDKSKHDCLIDCTSRWERNIRTIRKTAGKYPQEIYAAVVRAIQLEWIFLQHVMKNAGYALSGVEKCIQENFLPCLFSEN